MNTKQNTHKLASPILVGKIIKIEKESSVVELTTLQEMVVDDYGLIHGGFIFGLADYAAMLAVNKPTVVLGKSETKFIKPVKIGDKLTAYAKIVDNKEKKKKIVTVNVVNQYEEQVFEGTFVCYILIKHVLEQ